MMSSQILEIQSIASHFLSKYSWIWCVTSLYFTKLRTVTIPPLRHCFIVYKWSVANRLALCLQYSNYSQLRQICWVVIVENAKQCKGHAENVSTLVFCRLSGKNRERHCLKTEGLWYMAEKPDVARCENGELGKSRFTWCFRSYLRVYLSV